jgi:hypothetical protein
MSKGWLLFWCAVAFVSSLVYVVSNGLPFGESVVLLLVPVVLAVFSWRWGL